MPEFARAILSVASLFMLTPASHSSQDSDWSTPPAIPAIGERMCPFVDGGEVSGVVTLMATPDRIIHLDTAGKADAGLPYYRCRYPLENLK